MKHHISWYNPEKTLILVQTVDDWTWDDVINASHEVNRLMDEVTHQVDVIYDLSASRTIPRGSLLNLRYIVAAEHPNDGMMIIVGHNPLLELFLKSVIAVFKARKIALRYQIVDTMEDALQIIKENH